ncbi:reticulon-like protein B1 [Cryptomeria japonica]|uniref:reticulon-like protein B1 n=1 Tax=Cryptomeria japonica TaxID=3369 RepID=UPI0025ABFCBD|nr:reticulon-like protein B1 [Cryptomeria japonica]XP_057853251.1 reticulon-like protein B1 [Cryptomeria japonica]XP_057853252.1 reticulon-like protein B1 [Cryptomeria japonica]XP_057853253.1 reticulon-like protein B1 [Cryptomeria japonica]XP_057853254.1 reticulon-like protein B1 [Cryptomeria japonica]
MAEHTEDAASLLDSVLETIHDKLPGHHSSSDSDSDDEKSKKKSEVSSAAASVTASVNRLFGRQKPVHSLFGGGKSADVILWRNKQVSASVLVGATAIWFLFECMGYHLLTLICHLLILSITVTFLWSKGSAFINKQSADIPKVAFSEEMFQNVASAFRFEINRLFAVLHDVASGKDLKKFVVVVAGLWILSLIGSCTSFLTLFYVAFLIAHTVPLLYEKYEDQIESFAEKAWEEIKKQYRIFDIKVLSKIPRGPLKEKKF